METQESKPIAADKFIAALKEKGLLPRNCKGFTISAYAGEPIYMHYTVLGDERLLEVAKSGAIEEEKQTELPLQEGEQVEELPQADI